MTDLALDPVEVRALLARLEAANDRLTAASADTSLLTGVASPAGDPASRAYTARLATLFAADRDLLERRIKHLRELLEKVGASADRLRAQDTAAADHLPG